jgi:SAM-dependent methyltransferase
MSLGSTKNTTLPSSYDPFAWIYNRHWGNSFFPIALPILDNLILSKLPRNIRILDLCCGTGQLAQKLSVLGYRVTGLDGSPEMLGYARKNAPGVEFLQADARNFKIRKKYHAVVSAFDSLNHIMKTGELATVFQCVYNALRHDGYFIFDLNTEAGYLDDWQGDFSIIEDDLVCAVQSSYNKQARLATFDATVFKLSDGNWYRNDILIYQKYHSPDRVRSALIKAGFTGIEAYGFGRESGLGTFTKESGRVFFLCRKPQNTGE